MKNIMHRTTVAGAALIGSLLIMPAQATIVFDYSSTTGSDIRITGGNVGDSNARYFDFAPSDNQFRLRDSNGNPPPFGDAVGLEGNFGTTKYQVGAISGGIASVLNSGIMTIHDGTGKDLTATVDWKNIGSAGTYGFLNVYGEVNLSSISYGGSNHDLLTFKNGAEQTVVLTFGFSTPQPTPLLDHLLTPGQYHETSFAGEMSAVPEPSTWVAGSGLLGMFLLVGSGVQRRICGVFRLGANNC